MIVETDNTFDFQDPKGNGPPHWVGKCIHCNSALYVTEDGTTDATVEHIRPFCGGGDNMLQNLALACKRCNNEKGIRHDPNVGCGGRSDEVIAAMTEKRMKRWRAPQ